MGDNAVGIDGEADGPTVVLLVGGIVGKSLILAVGVELGELVGGLFVGLSEGSEVGSKLGTAGGT